MTIEELLSARAPDGTGLYDDDPIDKASMAAATVLAQNYLDTGGEIQDLADDITDTISMLNAWRNALLLCVKSPSTRTEIG